MSSPSATRTDAVDACQCSMDSGLVHKDSRWELHYADVRWDFPALRCPHSRGASASRLMRLLGHRVHTTCTSTTTPTVSVCNQRVSRALTPTPSLSSLASASSSSIFTHRSSSTLLTTPPSSPPKSPRPLPASHSSSGLSLQASLRTKNRRLERDALHCNRLYAKPPHYHTSLLRSSLPRRRGNFRKFLSRGPDFFREEVTRHGGFSQICDLAQDVLGGASSSIAINVAEAALCSYETRAGFFGWHGLSLSEDVYDSVHDSYKDTTDSTLNTLITEEEVEEGRMRWLEVMNGIIRPVPFRTKSGRSGTVQLPAVQQPNQLSQVMANAASVTRSRQARSTALNEAKSNGMADEGKHVTKESWRDNPPPTPSPNSVQGYQPAAVNLHIARVSRPAPGYSQVVGPGHGNVHGSATSARFVPRGKDAPPTLEPFQSRKPDIRIPSTSGTVSQPSSGDFYSSQHADGASNGNAGVDVYRDQWSVIDWTVGQTNSADSRTSHSSTMVTSVSSPFKSKAIFPGSRPSSDSQPALLFPALNDGYVQESSRRTIPSPDTSGAQNSNNVEHGASQSVKRPRSAGSGSEQSTGSESSPGVSLRALAASPANSVGLRKDSQGFWEPVTPPGSPHVVRGQASVRSEGSSAGSPFCSDSPGSISESTPASTTISSATSPPPGSPSLCYSSELQNSFESLEAPNPTSLLPAFLASATKRKREKTSRTREIVDRLRLREDGTSDGKSISDAGSANASKVSLREGTDDWTVGLDGVLSAKMSGSSSRQTGTAIRSGSPHRSTSVPGPSAAPSKSASSSGSAFDMKTAPAVAKPSSDAVSKHSSGPCSTSAVTVQGNGWIEMIGPSLHGRPTSRMQSHRPACPTPAGSTTAPSSITAFQPQLAQPVRPPIAPAHPAFPSGTHDGQPPPPPVPVVHLPTQQQQQPVFYGPAFPVYHYPVVPPPQPMARGPGQPPWVLTYRPPQPVMNPPTQATPITGMSGMRHTSW